MILVEVLKDFVGVKGGVVWGSHHDHEDPGQTCDRLDAVGLEVVIGEVLKAVDHAEELIGVEDQGHIVAGLRIGCEVEL